VKYAFMLAVGARNEILPFSVNAPADRLAVGGLLGQHEGAIVTHVNVVSLDEFLPAKLKPSIDLVKLDVEGVEDQCLKGMKKIVSTSRPKFIFECTHEATAVAVQAFFQQNGYNFLEIDDENETVTPVDGLKVYMDAPKRPTMAKLNRMAVPAGTVLSFP
jgi:Methyltransferase FkbM domain